MNDPIQYVLTRYNPYSLKEDKREYCVSSNYNNHNASNFSPNINRACLFYQICGGPMANEFRWEILTYVKSKSKRYKDKLVRVSTPRGIT